MTEIHDFDREIDRRNTSSSKWEKYRDRDILPMWVADSDFAVAPAIQQALIERAQHPVFGYTDPPEKLIGIIVDRMKRLYDWEIEPSWLIFLPGVVGAMHCACRGIGEPGDDVFTPAVVYPNINQVPELSSRQNRQIPMTTVDGRMIIDLEWLQDNPAEKGRVLVLCNPQNPGGAIYRESELLQLAEIADQQGLVICSDEIHCELILDPGKRHIPIGSINADVARRSITLMAPSKTFNLAGLGFSFAIVPDRKLRLGMLHARKGIVPYNGMMGYAAAEAAYEFGDEWNRQQCAYLATNRDFLLQQLNSIEGVYAGPVEATYLAWIDVSQLGLADPPGFFEAAGVGMSAGHEFGDTGWMRFNFACPYARVVKAVERIQEAVGVIA
jgi:cystathionine beta-lyase